MKNYARNAMEAHTFILSYEIVGDDICIKYASGETFSMPYSKEAEQTVLTKMEQQINDIYPDHSVSYKNLGEGILLLILAIVALSLTGFNFAVAILGLLALQRGAAFTFECVATKKIADDICKLKYFVMNKKNLNEKVADQESLKEGLSRKAVKRMTAQQKQGVEELTINNIDDYSWQDLSTIRLNIEKAKRMLEIANQRDSELTDEVNNSSESFQKKLGGR